jgi:D-aminoacyl-tRNA deacylase
MRAVLQRVSSASVTVAGGANVSIGAGLVALAAVQANDTEDDVAWLAKKMVELRLFPGEDGRMDRSLIDIGGELLVVSQFTLLGVTRKGTRPSYHRSALPDEAVPLYASLVARSEALLGRPVRTGTFGAEMKLALTNDGPVTIILDSRRKDL